jgi:hypothetical protein
MTKTAQAWIEEVAFVECPDCHDTVELGSGVSFSDGDEASCNCGSSFKILAPAES